MKATQLEAIRARLKAAPTFVPHVHTYGTTVVMITCENKRTAEALAEFLKHARDDIEALLGEQEPEQASLFDVLARPGAAT
jgi:hypothetical protein